ncbi:MAG: transposase [Candidatus Marinimicrobia bacterium]|nr:transposase [Candidatus Neomarinimicrobiota bacterium]
MTYIQGHYYHIYNRGCNKEKIFFCEDNYYYLLKKMKMSFQDCGANVIAYCLMPNHYHLLVQQLTEKELSKWLRKIFVGYSQAINKQQNRSGTLFESRPKHIEIDKEEYLSHLMWYIHTNPASAGIVAKPEQWKFSNYLECIGKRNGKLFDKDFIHFRYGSYSEYEHFINNYQCNQSFEKEIRDYLID